MRLKQLFNWTHTVKQESILCCINNCVWRIFGLE